MDKMTTIHEIEHIIDTLSGEKDVDMLIDARWLAIDRLDAFKQRVIMED